ncbi:MAG: NYN domain-containing protein [Patescibacteria group bacterium]
MRKPDSNYAFIDAQNVYMGTRATGWTIDAFKLRVYLRETFDVERAYWFVGFLSDMQDFYTLLQRAGYVLIFKEVSRDHEGTPKGNVDVDLTLHAVDLQSEYDKAVLLTSDGDFASLVRYLRERGKLRAILSPNRARTSRLLRKAVGSSASLQYLEDAKQKIARAAL